MSLLAIFKGKGPSGFGYGSTAEDVTQGLDLGGRTILLTGCNSGIGKETLRVLAKRGAHVIAAARTVEKAQAACDEVGGETTPVACELSEPASVQACAAQVIELGRPLDAIICNAGIMALPRAPRRSAILRCIRASKAWLASTSPTATWGSRAVSAAMKRWPPNFGKCRRTSSRRSLHHPRPRALC